MVAIACFVCHAWCYEDCYFTHAPVMACHNTACPNHRGTRRYDRVFYRKDWRTWISFSHDDVTEYNMPKHLCTPDMRLTQLSEEADGTLAVKMERPGMNPSVIYLVPRRRRERRQPLPQDVPEGWTYQHYHFDLDAITREREREQW